MVEALLGRMDMEIMDMAAISMEMIIMATIIILAAIVMAANVCGTVTIMAIVGMMILWKLKLLRKNRHQNYCH